MIMRFWLIAVWALFLPAVLSAGPLDSTLIILDLGHQGNDPGTHRKKITESQLILATAIPLRAELRAAGATVVMTVLAPAWTDTVWLGQTPLPDKAAEYFALDGQPLIRKNRSGFEDRFRVAQEAMARFPGYRTIWLSLHFDYTLGPHREPAPAGTRIIHQRGDYDTLLSNSLAEAFNAAGLRRADPSQAVVSNGRAGLGRDLIVLRGSKDPAKRKRHRQETYNPVASRFLLELANLRNADDWEWLHDASAIPALVKAIVNGLSAGHSEQPISSTPRPPP